jgi:ATP-dependent Clp protease ATP-binding subunit ClpA
VFERFTERARQVVVLAQDEARALRHNYIGTEHLLLGLLREEEGLGARVLETLDVTAEEVRAQVALIIGEGDEVKTGQIPFTPRAKRVLELALREALQLGHNHIGTEHILLGLVHEGEGVAMRILLDLDVDAQTARNEVIRVLSGGSGPVEPVAPLAPDLQEEIRRVRAEKEAALEAQEFEKAASLGTRERNLLRLGRSGDVEGFWEETRRPLSTADLRLPRREPRPLPRPPASHDSPGPVGRTLPFLAGGATFGAALGLGILLGRLIWG